MVSSKPRVSDSVPTTEEECKVQVLDSNEPLVLRAGAAPSAASTSGTGVPILTPGPSGAANSTAHNLSDDEFILRTGSSRNRRHYTADELRSSWSWGRFYKTLGTEEQCVRFAEERGLIPVEQHCPYHKRPMTLTTGAGSGHLGKFRCRKSNCRNRSISRATGTWFENVKLSLTVIFQLMYAFAEEASYHQVQREVATMQDNTTLSHGTIADWYNYCKGTISVYETDFKDEEKSLHCHAHPFEKLIVAIKYVYPL